MEEGWDDLVGDWRPAQGKATLVLDGGEPLADGQVVLLHVMAKALKQGATVCLLSTQAKSHYQAAVRKLGVNLSHHESDGSFSYDALIPAIAPSPGTGGSQLAFAVPTQASDAVDASSDAQPRTGISVMRLEVPSGNLQDSFGAATLDVQSCVKHVAETLKGMGDRTMILIDDLTIVAGVYGEATSVSLVQSIYGFARWLKAMFVLRAGDYGGSLRGLPGETQAPLPLLPYLLRTCASLIEVRPLTSGYSKDVFGQIALYPQQCQPEELFNYKVVESGIKCGRITRPRVSVTGNSRT